MAQSLPLSPFASKSRRFKSTNLWRMQLSDAKSLKRFRGSQPINSLAVYPMRFDASAVNVKKNLLARGKLFLELTGSPYAHKMLIGKTLDEPPEEV